MSGTSLDGLDIAFCSFFLNEKQEWGYMIEKTDCVQYDAAWKESLGNAHNLSGLQLMALHQQYGRFIADSVNGFIRKHGLQPDLIASHGHTIFHDPGQMLSFQLGHGAAIYAGTGIPVVCDFRSVDVSLGGQGAPLVPIGDALLFKQYECCLNLGGIANISYDRAGKRIAYDICGCNLLLNMIAQQKGYAFDSGGAWARLGTIDTALLLKLNKWDYLQKQAPKSLDKETMLAELGPIIQSSRVSFEDKLATIVEHIAIQIAKATEGHIGTLLMTGGGAFNGFLVERIQEKTTPSCLVPDENLVNYKEALIFAFLGLLRARGEVNTLASVTGAKTDSIGGAIYGALDPNIQGFVGL